MKLLIGHIGRAVKVLAEYGHLSLSAEATIGAPVQWKPIGNGTFLPGIRMKPTVNSVFVTVKAWLSCQPARRSECR